MNSSNSPDNAPHSNLGDAEKFKEIMYDVCFSLTTKTTAKNTLQMQRIRRHIVQIILSEKLPDEKSIEFLRQTYELLEKMTTRSDNDNSFYLSIVDSNYMTFHVNVKDELQGLSVCD